MSDISKKVLEFLQANFENSSFIRKELISNGFSEAEVTTALKELEENGYIYVEKTYVNGTTAYALL